MRTNDRNRLALAALFSIFAHITAFVLFLPLIIIWEVVTTWRKNENDTLKVALLLALLLHLAVILPLLHLLLSMQRDDGGSDLLRVDLWERAPTADQLLEKSPQEELESYEPKEEIPEGVVVRVPPAKDKRPPEKATRFLSEHDARVAEETVARVRLPGITEAAPSPALKGRGREVENEPGGLRREDVVTEAPPSPERERADDGAKPASEAAPPALEDINLTPSKETLASALKGTGLDHMEGVIEGDTTALNTMGWSFASFFNRVKDQVERYWHPDREYRARDPYGNIYGFKDRVTVLLVILRGDGSLKSIHVLSPSGAAFLDDEAVQAVEQAAPFPNVPEGLKDKHDGLVKFTFHFIVEVGNRPVFRMRRY